MTGNRWTADELNDLTVPQLRALAGEMPRRWQSAKADITAWILEHAPRKTAVPVPAPTLKGVGRYAPTSVRIPPEVKAPAQQRATAEGLDLTTALVRLLTMYAAGHVTLKEAAR